MEKVLIPEVNENEILIKVKYCGICGSDIPRSMNIGARYYPIILGHEFSGFVEKIGDNVQGLKYGDSVAVAPLIPCNNCINCKSSQYGLCQNYNIIGTGSNGGFAQYVKAHKEHVLKLSKKMDLETAAGIEPTTIGYHGVIKANIIPGETIVVLGCGPIGQLTIQWAKIFGASQIIAVDILEEKLEMALLFGATHIINAQKGDPVRQIHNITNGGLMYPLKLLGTLLHNHKP